MTDDDGYEYSKEEPHKGLVTITGYGAFHTVNDTKLPEPCVGIKLSDGKALVMTQAEARFLVNELLDILDKIRELTQPKGEGQ